jgi:hypothetical protein
MLNDGQRHKLKSAPSLIIGAAIAQFHAVILSEAKDLCT